MAKKPHSPMFWQCMHKVRQIAGENLTAPELEELAERLLARAREIRTAHYGMTADEAVNRALKEMSEEIITASQLKRRNTYLINARFSDALGYIQAAWADRPRDGLAAMLVGSNIGRRGAQKSIDADQKGLANAWRNGFEAEVERGGKHKLYSTGDLDPDAYKALDEIYKDNPNWLGIDRDAREFAEIIYRWQETIRVSANNAGAWIKKLPDYITHQSHDQFKVRTAARQLKQATGIVARMRVDQDTNFKAWRDYVLPRLDHEATFAGMPQTRREEWLRSVWLALASGEHLRGVTSSNGFSAAGSLAGRMSENRILRFKDATARFEYDHTFSRGGSLYERVGHQLHTAAHNVALMQRLGPNPQEVYNRLKNAARLLTERSVDARMADQWRRDEMILDAYFSEVMGTANIPGADPFSAALRGVRLAQTLSKLGGAVLSSLTDTAVAASELQFQGFSPMEAWRVQLEGILQGYGKRGKVRADRMQLASELGVAVDWLRSAAFSRFSAEDALPGWMARAQHFFFKANGLMWWTDTLRMANAQGMSHRIASFKDRALPELDAHTQRLFKMFDITAAEWDLMRRVSIREVEGKEYFTPRGAAQLTDVELSYLVKKEGNSPTDRRIGERRNEIEAKFRDLFSARSDYAVLVPGPRTRSFMTGSRFGFQSGTPASEIMRSLSQFKGFPATIIEKVWGRELFGHGETGKLGDVTQSGMVGLAKFMAFSTFLGFASMWLKAYFNGRRMEAPESQEEAARLFLAAFLQGGGAGLYGDFLMGQAKDRFGHAWWESLMGPSVPAAFEGLGLLRDASRLPFDIWFDKLKEGDGDYGDLFFALKNNAPFVNLFYTRMALDYMLLYELQEMAVPGSLKRTEDNFKKNLNQHYVLPPSRKTNITDLTTEDIGSLLNPL